MNHRHERFTKVFTVKQWIILILMARCHQAVKYSSVQVLYGEQLFVLPSSKVANLIEPKVQQSWPWQRAQGGARNTAFTWLVVKGSSMWQRDHFVGASFVSPECSASEESMICWMSSTLVLTKLHNPSLIFLIGDGVTDGNDWLEVASCQPTHLEMQVASGLMVPNCAVLIQSELYCSVETTSARLF